MSIKYIAFFMLTVSMIAIIVELWYKSRENKTSENSCISLGNLQININMETVSVNNCRLNLSKKEYETLLHLIYHRKDKFVKNLSIAKQLYWKFKENHNNYEYKHSNIRNIIAKLDKAGANIEIKSIQKFEYKLTVH